ncbi:hypothetical protein MP638_001771 [Amoeboaphelidium occidentale]|nr:hypothetical protein MP638_001771 [Amoeboaphelidium occidentale]
MLTELRQTNYEISQRNIANEAPQRLLREEVAELQQLVATKQSTLQQLTEQKQRLLKDFSPEASYAKLKEATEQAEAVSESIASQFLKGDITQDDFVRNFRDSRTIYHMRSAKLERLL